MKNETEKRMRCIKSLRIFLFVATGALCCIILIFIGLEPSGYMNENDNMILEMYMITTTILFFLTCTWLIVAMIKLVYKIFHNFKNDLDQEKNLLIKC